MTSHHPRYKHFPWQRDYAAQPNLFCPYAMAVAQPNYRSPSLNIDSLGFRHQSDQAGRLIDLKSARDCYADCMLMLGNSTAFGVSLTRDGRSIGHLFGTMDSPCVNLSVRGATMQQELAIFLTFKHLLPRLRKIVILTGVCDVSLATQPLDLWSQEAGSMHSSDTFIRQFYERAEKLGDRPMRAKSVFLRWAEDQYLRSSWLQKLFERRAESAPFENSVSAALFEANLDDQCILMGNVLQTWGWIKKATGVDIQVILQPVVGWTTKPLSTIEEECIRADLERVPAIPLYANRPVYQGVRDFFRLACEQNQLGFSDANTGFDLFHNDETLFSDICHLTDQGTRRLAEWMSLTLPEMESIS